VGTFTGTHAAADRPPTPGSTASRAAFADCDAKVRTFAGGGWRGVAMSLMVVLPDLDRWSGGARWFRCDVAELVSVDSGLKKRTGSLRGVVKAGKPPVYSCFTEDEWEQLWPAACTAKHRYEFVGIWTAPDIALEDLEGKNERIFRECRKAINVFLGLPRSSGIGQLFGVSYRLPAAWSWGDRGVLCFLWSEDLVLTRSLRRTGARGLIGG